MSAQPAVGPEPGQGQPQPGQPAPGPDPESAPAEPVEEEDEQAAGAFRLSVNLLSPAGEDVASDAWDIDAEGADEAVSIAVETLATEFSGAAEGGGQVPPGVEDQGMPPGEGPGMGGGQVPPGGPPGGMPGPPPGPPPQ